MNRISTPGKLRQRMNVELFRMEAVQCERGLAGGGQISNPLWSGLIQTVNKIIQSLFQKSFHWVKMKVISNVSSSFLTMLVIFMKPLKVSTRQLLVAAWKDSPLCWSDAVWERTDTFVVVINLSAITDIIKWKLSIKCLANWFIWFFIWFSQHKIGWKLKY